MQVAPEVPEHISGCSKEALWEARGSGVALWGLSGVGALAQRPSPPPPQERLGKSPVGRAWGVGTCGGWGRGPAIPPGGNEGDGPAAAPRSPGLASLGAVTSHIRATRFPQDLGSCPERRWEGGSRAWKSSDSRSLWSLCRVYLERSASRENPGTPGRR